MPYVDGFIAAVPRDNRDAFVAHARAAGALLAALGATRQVECWANDVTAGTRTDFLRAVECAADEEVVFSWIEYPDRATRDAAMAGMIADPRMEEMPMPFDGGRMVFGGFAPMLDDGGDGPTGYVDGCLIPVPTNGRDAYLDFATISATVMRDHGATRVVEAWGDDVPAGTRTDFARAVALAPEETVVFSWIEWPSAQARNAGWGAIMADDRMAGRDMPFDGARMVYGGFIPIVDTGSEAAA